MTSITSYTQDISSRIDAIGWGSLFVMTGVVLLAPGLPDGSWLLGFGAILLAANAARVALGLEARWLGIIVGAGAVLGGAGAIAGLDLPVIALVLIATGLVLIAGQFTGRQRVRA